MLQIDTLLGFGIGLSYAMAGREVSEREASVLRNPCLAIANVAAGLFFYPWGVYYFTVWPSWESFYWLDFTDDFTGHPVESMLVPLFVMSMVIAVNLGFGLGHQLIHRRKLSVIRTITAAAYAGVIAILLLNLRALLWVGTTEQFRQANHDGAVPTLRSPFLPYFLGSLMFFVAGLVWCGLWIRRRARDGAL